MRTIKQHTKKIAFVLSLTFLFISCSSNEDYNRSDPNENTVGLNAGKHSGIELFKGIFFSEGNVALQLSNHKKFEKLKAQFTKEQNIAFINLQNNLIEDISRDYPHYFENFENSMNSGNQIVIRNELENSKAILKSVVQKRFDLNYEEIEQQIANQKNSLVVNLDDIQNLKSQIVLNGYNPSEYKQELEVIAVWAVGVVVAAVAWVAVYVDIVYWSATEQGDPTMNMENEQFVNSIAQLNVED